MFFSRDVSTGEAELRGKGYVLLRGAAAPELIEYLAELYAACEVGKQADIASGHVYGKKKQFLFDFPDAPGREDFRDQICKLVGYPPEALTISERHIKAYDAHAPAYPAPHKDRAASEYSIGIPIRLSAQTSVCMFPQLDRRANELKSAAFLSELSEAEIAALYDEDETVYLQAEVGDILVFEGSAMFHERVKPAGSVLLYIKINADGLDPLGENVFGDARGALALEA